MTLSNCLTLDVVPELDISILAHCRAHIATVADCHVVDAAGVEVKDALALECFKVELPQASLEVLDEPEVVTTDHVDDLGGVTFRSPHLTGLDGLN